MPQWDYMCKDFLRGNTCEREGRKRDGEGWGSFQAADLTLGAGRRQKLAEVSETSVRYEEGHRGGLHLPGTGLLQHPSVEAASLDTVAVSLRPIVLFTVVAKSTHFQWEVIRVLKNLWPYSGYFHGCRPGTEGLGDRRAEWRGPLDENREPGTWVTTSL